MHTHADWEHACPPCLHAAAVRRLASLDAEAATATSPITAGHGEEQVQALCDPVNPNVLCKQLGYAAPAFWPGILRLDLSASICVYISSEESVEGKGNKSSEESVEGAGN